MENKNQKSKLVINIPVELSRKMREAILFQKGNLKKGDITDFVVRNIEKEINRILEQKEKR